MESPPSPTVQQVLTQFFPPFADQHALDDHTFRILWRLRACRTPELGGFRYECGACGHTVRLYRSCRDRHCPTCQGGRRRTWAQSMAKTMLPVPHFQVVFTLPKPLWPVARRFPKEVFGILLKAAAQALTDVAAYRWDALPTVLSVLHTWNRKMDFYPHVHCIVSAGGLRQDGSWYAHGTDFLFPRKMLRKRFRGKFLAMLRDLGLPLDAKGRRWLQRIRSRVANVDWYTYTEKPEGRPTEHALRYLAQYVHGIAISDYRILSMDNETVTFRVRGEETRTMPGPAFVEAFAQHILPKGFHKLRQSGLLATANRAKLARVRAEMKSASTMEPTPPSPPPQQDLADLADKASNKGEGAGEGFLDDDGLLRFDEDDLPHFGDPPPTPCCPACGAIWFATALPPEPGYLRGPP